MPQDWTWWVWAGYCLPASDWPYGYARSVSRRAPAFDCLICFILRSGTCLQGVPGSASSCVHAAADHLFFSSDPLAILAARCRHLRAGHIWILSDGKNASLLPWNRTEPITPDLVRRTFLSRPRLLDQVVSSTGCGAGLCSIEAQVEPGPGQGGTTLGGVQVMQGNS